MKKNILIILLFLMSISAEASNIEDARHTVSSKLNDTVKTLKILYRDLDIDLNNTKTESETLKVTAENLFSR